MSGISSTIRCPPSGFFPGFQRCADFNRLYEFDVSDMECLDGIAPGGGGFGYSKVISVAHGVFGSQTISYSVDLTFAGGGNGGRCGVQVNFIVRSQPAIGALCEGQWRYFKLGSPGMELEIFPSIVLDVVPSDIPLGVCFNAGWPPTITLEAY